jgi:hypothetical protein
MKRNGLVWAGAAMALTLGALMHGAPADAHPRRTGKIKHVLLLSIDGMHAVDFYNCANGIPGVNNGNPYCPNLAALGQTAINYVNATSSKPSDSFPGLTALVSGGSPKTTGVYYDVAYDRALDAPTTTTGTGLAGGPCTPNGTPTGTTTDYDQGIDLDDTKLNGGAPGAGLTEGGAASIDPNKLVRDPKAGCAPVYPWNFIRANTIFGVVHAAGGYTAWIDKHPSNAFVSGPGDGTNVNDFYAPEVDSAVVALPGVQTSEGASCATIRDPNADLTSWTNSFLNIQCYDAIKVNALLNQIAGKTHDGAAAVTPTLFGMNFQSVYIGQSLNEPGVGSGGYQNAAALPSSALLNQIEYVDSSIGEIVDAVKSADLTDDTLIVVTAKHGESPIDPTRYVANGSNTPATLLGTAIPFSESPLNPTRIGATEDDVSVLWLTQGASVSAAVELLESNATAIGLGQIYSGPTLALNYNVGGIEPGQDSRTPDIIVTPNVGVTYSGSTTMIGDHGGFAHDDTNVILLVAKPGCTAQTISAAVSTAEVAPTILTALGLDPISLDAVKAEGTPVLPGFSEQFRR